MLNNLLSSLLKKKDSSSPKFLKHFILKTPLEENLQPNEEEILFGCGCFWGAEKSFWKLPGVKTTSVGYAGGKNINPTYQQVCSGKTNHAEVVRVTWDTKKIDLSDLLKMFWECHDPTQGNRQGNDRGTQYRSVIYTYKANHTDLAFASKSEYQRLLRKSGFGEITTEIKENINFYFAEEYHQQYLAKPGSRPYCSAMPTKIALGSFKGENYMLNEKVWLSFDWNIRHCVLRSDNNPIIFG